MIATRLAFTTFVISSTIVFLGCSKSGSSGAVQTKENQKTITEFTAINPLTGKPLKPEELTAEILREDPINESDLFEQDPVSLTVRSLSSTDFDIDDITTKEISYPEVDVDKEKESAMFGYQPKGQYNSSLSTNCHFTELENIMSMRTAFTSEIANRVQEWQKLCEKELSKGRTSAVTSALRFENVKYDLKPEQFIPLEFTFHKEQTKLSALLFLKDEKVRPLVVFKSGLYGDAKDGGVLRNFIMHLSEESPFHVLYLANVTGEQFTVNNGDLFLGGFDEGRQILRVIHEIMEKPEIRARVHDVHVAGVSLGSHGVMYSALYSSFQPADAYKIKSAFAFCPVVDLKPTMESVFDDSIRGIFYESLTLQFLKKIFKYVPILGDLINPEDNLSRKDLFKAIKKGTIQNYIRRTQKTPWDLAPFDGLRIENEEQFWQVNNYTAYAQQNTTPMMVVHAKDDFLVLPDFNVDALYEKLRNQNSDTGIVRFENGSHCGFNVALGWPTISSMLREHVLRNTDYRSDEEVVRLEVFNKAQFPKLQSRNNIAAYSWDYNFKKKQFLLEISYVDYKAYHNNHSCGRYKPAMAPAQCLKSVELKIGATDLAPVRLGPLETEKEYIRAARWLNARGHLVNEADKNILSTTTWPKTFVVRTSYN